MASRRLDISSLLCDDAPPFSPLDALVHAATEERRRLVTEHPPTRYDPREMDRRELDHRQRRDLDHRELERRDLEHRELQRRELERRELEHRELERREHERRELERRDLERRELERRELGHREYERQLAERREYARREAELVQRYMTSPRAMPSISHLISHSLNDRTQPTVIPLTSSDDQRPIKKPRYSTSPPQPHTDDRERIARDREKMLVGELGYGRTDSPLAGPSHPPRRPGSGAGHDHTRKVALADLLAVDKDRPPPAEYRVLSPLGRRSPPGSQIGRAKAARKSDDHLLREEPKPPLVIVRSPVVDQPRPKKPLAKDPPKLQQPPQDDAHEWFLQQFDEEPSPTTSAPPHTPSPSASPVTALAAPPPAAKTPPPPHRSLTPVTAAVSLEEELEELVSDPLPPSSAIVKKQDPDIDMEVDLAVTELVDTLEADDNIVKHEPKPMEVDVEDELLSLLDDTPKPPPPSSLPATAARRNPPSSAVPSASSHVSAPTASATYSHAHPHSHAPPKQAPHQNQNHSTSEAPHVAPNAAAAVSPVIARHPSTRPTSERGSMPPPASTTVAGKKSTDSAVPTPHPAAARKKKETKATSAKSKNAGAPAVPAPAKKARPPAKGKKNPAASAAETTSPGTATPPASARGPKGPTAGSGPARKTAPSTSRSRSTSAMPGRTSAGPESDAVKAEKQEEEESEGEANEDDKLYCVCKTKYDEDRFMIACDRCDEWYHTQCVKMPDLEVDLVDQFICPLCIEKNPRLNLRTTYKARCLYGMRHPDPSSTRACHKAARGAFSKYCSDECGVKYMQSRVDNWAKKGGKPERLWESVKGAEKREGVVCAVEPAESDAEEEPVDVKPPAPNGIKMDVDADAPAKPEPADDEDVKKSPKSPKPKQSAPPALQKAKSKYPHIKTRVVPPTTTKLARETARLNGLLDAVIRMREEIKRGIEVVVWRERLLQLATARAETVGQCGWDQRLCMDDDEWADAAEGVLESYDDAIARADAVKEGGGDGEMEVDGPEEQWWCPGKKVCDRHQGWQTVRLKDVGKEKEKKEEALAKLTTREREIRKRIEDMLDPHTTSNPTNGSNGATHNGTKDTTAHVPLKSSNVKSVNGHSKAKVAASGDGQQKKGKKRKAPAS